MSTASHRNSLPKHIGAFRAAVTLMEKMSDVLNEHTKKEEPKAILPLAHTDDICFFGVSFSYDGILAMKNGRIVEMGTFDELMAQRGYFHSLYTISRNE